MVYHPCIAQFNTLVIYKKELYKIMDKKDYTRKEQGDG